MLDENLPAFILKPSADGIKHHKDIYLTYQGSDPAPNYLLHHADPAATNTTYKNCYAAAIFDCFNPDVLYGEVLARPGWTQPTLSAEEIRRNNGIPPPPQPIIPNDFVIQLYNPDQQIKIEVRPGKWAGSDSYEFSMPQNTFRAPSASNIDRGQSDPASLATTPKINFVWKRESKLSKDLTCFMTGRSTDTFDRRKARKDPDIPIALWRSMRELTIYEPNLQRMELEDPKGMEVVLLLGAIVIKDLFFTSKEHVRELFNVNDVSAERKLSGGGLKLSDAQPIAGAGFAAGPPPMPPRSQSPSSKGRNSFNQSRTSPPQTYNARPPPMADPRSKWELEAETARLRAQADAEARELQRQKVERERAIEAERQRLLREVEQERLANEQADEAERKRLLKLVEQERLASQKAEEAERKRLLKLVEQEEKEARRKQAEIDKETERLRKQYGVEPIPNERPQANTSHARQRLSSQSPYLGDNGLYTSGSSSQPHMMSGGNGGSGGLPVPKPTKKKSFFGLRSHSDDA